MSQAEFQSTNPYASFGATIADAPATARADFIRKTYSHLTIAVFAFAAICWALISSGLVEQFAPMLMQSSITMIAFFGGFMLVSYVADHWARTAVSPEKQYAGLVLYVLAQAIFISPMLWVAQDYALQLGDGQEVAVIPAAGVITLIMFAGLSGIAWFSGTDFSFLRAGLGIAGMAALGLIVCGMIFGFNLGTWFSVAMIVFASAYILYDTSNVMHHYREGQHVAAALALFASVALLFFYVLRLLLALSSRE